MPFVFDASLTMAWAFEDESSLATLDRRLRTTAEQTGVALFSGQ